MRLEFRVEKDVSDQVLDVVFDREGVEHLLAQLQFLTQNRTEHFHLFSEAWGSDDLTHSEDDQNAFNQVNVYLVAGASK